MKKDLITVIIPFYKVENQIERCLNSVINQTYKNLEVLCIGSQAEDVTKTIVKKYEKANKNIHYLEQDGKGNGNARNKGIDMAKGEYILFLDGDDYIEKDAIEQLYNNIKKTKSDITCCGFDRIDDITGKIYSREMISMNYNTLTINSDTINEIAFLSPSPWGKLFKKDIINTTRFNEKPVAAEDLLFFLEIISKSKKMSFIKKELWHYVVRSDSLIFNTTKEKANELRENLLKVRKKFIAENLNINYIKMLDTVAFLHCGISMISRLSGNTKNLNKYIKNTKKYLDDNFEYWKSNRIRIGNKITLKTIILNIVRLSYKLNLFIIFIKMYNFMIKYLKIDIKW